MGDVDHDAMFVMSWLVNWGYANVWDLTGVGSDCTGTAVLPAGGPLASSNRAKSGQMMAKWCPAVLFWIQGNATSGFASLLWCSERHHTETMNPMKVSVVKRHQIFMHSSWRYCNLFISMLHVYTICYIQDNIWCSWLIIMDRQWLGDGSKFWILSWSALPTMLR